MCKLNANIPVDLKILSLRNRDRGKESAKNIRND